MYEDQTFDVIMGRLLDEIPDSLDKRQGSIIYDALAPAATELVEVYIQLDATIALGFMETSAGDFVDMKIEEIGDERKDSVAAVRSATANVSVPVGQRFLIENVYFVATTSGINFEVTCEEEGVTGNLPGGPMTAIANNVQGLTSAVLGAILIPGVEIEDDESVKERYFNLVREPSTSGNMADYRKWALSVEGVGAVRVLPETPEPGLVTLVLLDPNKRAVTQTVANKVKAYIDPVDGEGRGVAPIGATTIATPATEKPINVSVNVTLAAGRTIEDVYAIFVQAFKDYLEDIAFKDDIVRITRVQGLLLGIPPIIDYDSLTLNGQTGNVQTGFTEVATVGAVTMNAV